MAHMMPIFQRGSRGRIVHRMIGAEQWPIPGWYDSPEKVPGEDPPLPAGYGITTVPPATVGPVYGEEKTKAEKARAQAKAAPRVNGRFVKAK